MAELKVDRFHVVDYVIFACVVVASFFIGVYHAVVNQSKTTEKYLMADRKLRIIPTAISIMVSYISAISILGHSAETYFYGVTYFFGFIGYIGSSLLVAVIFVPLFYPLQLTSVNEYFYLRYNSRLVVYVGTVLQVMAFLCTSGVVLYGPATMLQSMAGWPEWATMLGLGVLSTIYTTIGGFKAVIWSDVFQSLVMFFGLLAILIIGTIKVGGAAEVWNIYGEHGRLDINIDPSPLERSTVWGFSFGVCFQFVVNFGLTQVAVQRYCALPSLSAAKKSMLATIPTHTAIQICTFVSGVVTFAYFASIGCDPYTGGLINNQNQVIPYYVLHVLNYPAVPGAFVAAVFCGCMSNLSSYYNSIAALVYQDIFKSKLAKQNEATKALVTKIIAFASGIASIAVSFIVAAIGGTLIKVVYSLNSITNAPFVVLVVCGALTRRPNYKCALLGAVVACAFTTWVAIGHQLSNIREPIKPTVTTNCSVDDSDLDGFIIYNFTAPETFSTEAVTTLADTGEEEPLLIYRISYVWYLPFGIVVGLITSFFASFLPYFTENNPDYIDPELMFTFMRGFNAKTYAVTKPDVCTETNESVFYEQSPKNHNDKIDNGIKSQDTSWKVYDQKY